MTEYIVKWRHLRYSKAADMLLADVAQHKMPAATARMYLADQEAKTTQEWGETGPHLSQHGGKTQCDIYHIVPSKDVPELWCEDEYAHVYVASAEAVCSWRDQFDRKAGRFYSLAYAMCDWQECPTLSDLTRRGVWATLAGLVSCFHCGNRAWRLLRGRILTHNHKGTGRAVARIIRRAKHHPKAGRRVGS